MTKRQILEPSTAGPNPDPTGYPEVEARIGHGSKAQGVSDAHQNRHKTDSHLAESHPASMAQDDYGTDDQPLPALERQVSETRATTTR